MAKRPSKKEEVEFESGAWERFERAIDVVAKSPPQPKKKNVATAKRKKKAAKR